MPRKEKRSRKYLGSRTWGGGNVKNRRGKGSRGGVGWAGRTKHRYTLVTAIGKEYFQEKGFVSRKPKLKILNLFAVNRIIEKENKQDVDLTGYKILSEGEISKPATIYASAFSKKAIEKITKAGGKAVVREEKPIAKEDKEEQKPKN